jgi:hypothetical protein
MERLTNNYHDLISQVRRDLHTVELNNDEDVLISYTEFPSFPGGQFCISVIATTNNNHLRLVNQTWDNDYDLKRFSSGIYNLDRLCIKKTDIKLSATQQNQLTTIINSIDQLPDKLSDESYIILDGTDYQLTLKTKKADKEYKWTVATKEIMHFEPLISFFLTVTSDK